MRLLHALGALSSPRHPQGRPDQSSTGRCSGPASLLLGDLSDALPLPSSPPNPHSEGGVGSGRVLSPTSPVPRGLLSMFWLFIPRVLAFSKKKLRTKELRSQWTFHN